MSDDKRYAGSFDGENYTLGDIASCFDGITAELARDLIAAQAKIESLFATLRESHLVRGDIQRRLDAAEATIARVAAVHEKLAANMQEVDRDRQTRTLFPNYDRVRNTYDNGRLDGLHQATHELEAALTPPREPLVVASDGTTPDVPVTMARRSARETVAATCGAGPGTTPLSDPDDARAAAYELVEREMRANGVYRVLLMGPPDDFSTFVEMGTGLTGDYGESWEADTLLAAGEVAKKRRP